MVVHTTGVTWGKDSPLGFVVEHGETPWNIAFPVNSCKEKVCATIACYPSGEGEAETG